SPSRGQLGNALKCVWAAAGVVDPERGRVTVETGGQRHDIEIITDRIAGEVVPRLTSVPSSLVKIGTRVTMTWPEIACSLSGQDAYVAGVFYRLPKLKEIVATYAACNPHVTFRLALADDDTTTYRATCPAWSKWWPTTPTSPHWYDAQRLTH